MVRIFNEIMIMSAFYLTNTFNCICSQKQQSVNIHVAPLPHIILIPSQAIFDGFACFAFHFIIFVSFCFCIFVCSFYLLVVLNSVILY